MISIEAKEKVGMAKLSKRFEAKMEDGQLFIQCKQAVL